MRLPGSSSTDFLEHLLIRPMEETVLIEWYVTIRDWAPSPSYRNYFDTNQWYLLDAIQPLRRQGSLSVIFTITIVSEDRMARVQMKPYWDAILCSWWDEASCGWMHLIGLWLFQGEPQSKMCWLGITKGTTCTLSHLSQIWAITSGCRCTCCLDSVSTSPALVELPSLGQAWMGLPGEILCKTEGTAQPLATLMVQTAGHCSIVWMDQHTAFT